MKKIRLASQDKSRSCSHSLCPFPSVITVTFGDEQRRLCQKHHDEDKRRGLEFKVIFQKASQI